ncbi:MAG: HAD-IB family phosphatase [Ignavibacteriales bacterium]|nr:HAD-IB family phosphatase [Ignavibacteriales bacterium]
MTAGIMAVENQVAPAELARALDQMEVRISQYNSVFQKIAVFDLDNTLLIGDIGEAVFANMLLREYSLGLTWHEYRLLLAHDKPDAYARVVTAMKGMSRLTVEEVTLSTLRKHSGEIRIDGELIPVPRPHPVLREFIRLLQWRGYRTLIVSASNQISVRIVARELFGIPEDDAFGIAPVVIDDVLTGTLVTPMPVWSGKVDVLRNLLGSAAPVITAGDSPLDWPMMRMCHEKGFSIWVGHDETTPGSFRGQFSKSHSMVFVPQTSFLPLQQ